MLYRKNNEWSIVPFKVKYTERGKEKEQYTHDKQWWLDFAEKWDHIEILEFIDVIPTADQAARVEEIKGIEEGFCAECSEYVETGELCEDNIALQNLKLKKDYEKLKQLLADLTAEVLLGGA